MKTLAMGTAVGVIAGLVTVSAASSTPNVPWGADPVAIESGGAQERPAYLGFEVGEERRYALGPPQELYQGEVATWSIRLVETLGSDPPDAVFELTHLWRMAGTRSEVPIGTLVQVESKGELRVNTHGFPRELRFETKRILAGWKEEAYTIRYRFEDGRFLKHVAIDGNDLEHVVAVAGNDDVDLSVPTGLYAMVPTRVNCSLPLPANPMQAAQVTPPQRTPGSTGSQPIAQPGLRFSDNSQCREQLFGNPGLISLMLPALWEEGTGEHEYVMLTPAGPFGMPGFSGGTQLSQSAGGLAIAGGSQLDHQTAIHPRTNSEIDNLRYIDRVSVQVGDRTEDAWRFEGFRGLGAVYVDDDGVVLRVDLDPSTLAGLSVRGGSIGFDPTRAERRDLWVRLLYPSEY